MSGELRQVVGVSLGSSARDHRVELELCGERFEVWREGCDNDWSRLKRRLIELDHDSRVAAIGLGGVDLYLESADRRYWFREIKPLAKLVTSKPFVDGGGLKSAFEKSAVGFMQRELGADMSTKTVLCTSGVDRWGLACGFEDAGAQVNYGDLLWALGIPCILRSKKSFVRVAHALAPLASKLPYSMLYDSNSDHTTEPKPNKAAMRAYREADIIAGDYKFVKQHMTERLDGKWVVTNTTTEKDVDFLRDKGIELMVTTTPRLEGRSFGTNVMEACLVAAAGSKTSLTADQYVELAQTCGLTPSITYL